MAFTVSTGTQNAMCDAVAARVDAGSGPGVIEIRTGSKPASANDAATGSLLATITLDDPAFDGASDGTADLLGVPLSGTGVADGTAGWFRVKDSDGGAVFDGTAGTSGTDLILASATISTGVTVQITSGSITVPAG